MLRSAADDLGHQAAGPSATSNWIAIEADSLLPRRCPKACDYMLNTPTIRSAMRWRDIIHRASLLEGSNETKDSITDHSSATAGLLRRGRRPTPGRWAVIVHRRWHLHSSLARLRSAPWDRGRPPPPSSHLLQPPLLPHRSPNAAEANCRQASVPSVPLCAAEYGPPSEHVKRSVRRLRHGVPTTIPGTARTRPLLPSGSLCISSCSRKRWMLHSRIASRLRRHVPQRAPA
mmetsp:Transcript_11706/g.43626  ORF Transcript_11706/g.43626 Transcript_11706/m.43626 type:complete len:231 (+) Transcript_11706:1180-1872(+)